jgi:GNAT superfamily N-acetyltransferase
MEKEVIADEKTLAAELFDWKRAQVLFILKDRKEIGYALYFYNFSTFVGHSGLYLEDLYIDEEYRDQGIGRATFRHLASLAEKEDCGRMEWVCLDWNTHAQKFYESLGAEAQKEWWIYRLDRKGIAKLGR